MHPLILFYSAENVTERGMYGFMNRTIEGTPSEQQEYFQDRRNLIEERKNSKDGFDSDQLYQ